MAMPSNRQTVGIERLGGELPPDKLTEPHDLYRQQNLWQEEALIVVDQIANLSLQVRNPR
jgi:hypothetical protein